MPAATTSGCAPLRDPVSYQVPSWDEHLRLHEERQTAGDEAGEQRRPTWPKIRPK